VADLFEAIVEALERGEGAEANKQVVLEQKREAILKDFALLAHEVLARFPDDADICVCVEGRFFALHR
jgi:hypothetical protein